jgi:hypothetical protein
MAKYKPVEARKIRECRKNWNDANKSNFVSYNLMMDFVFGDQWQDDEADVFKTYKKRPFTANHIAPMAAHLIGEQRKNTPQLQVEAESGIDQETADIREALIKKISLDGHAKVVYQMAYQNATIGGAGAYYWGTEYEDDNSFLQCIKPYIIRDTTKAYWDLGALEVCKTDGMHSGFAVPMTRAKFRVLYGKKLEEKIGDTTLDSDDNNSLDLGVNYKNSIFLINHYSVNIKSEKLYLLSNGKTLSGDEVNDLEKVYDETSDDNEKGWFFYKNEPVRIERTRLAPMQDVTHSIWAGDYELDSTEFASKQLPLLFVDQNSTWDKNGRQIWRPFFKDARDTQIYINYLRTQMAYLVKISRNDQFMGSKKNVASADTAKAWKDPSVVQGLIPYDETPSGTKPEQLRPAEIPQSLLAQYQEAKMDLMGTTGIYDVQMGNQGDVVSGKASDAQVKRGGINTFITRDALDRSIIVSGEIVNEMIPTIYDSERELSLLLPGQGQQSVSINKPMDAYGSTIKNYMTKGKYKVRLIPGSSYEGQKSENLEAMQVLMQAQETPGFNMVADLFVKSLPMSNSTELENRYRSLVPPELIEAGKTGKPVPPKPQPPDPMIMLKMQELQQKAQQSQQTLQLKMAELSQKREEMMLNAHMAGADMTVQLKQIETEREDAEAQFKSDQRHYELEWERIRQDANKHHSDNTLKILTHEPKFLEPKEPKNDSPKIKS